MLKWWSTPCRRRARGKTCTTTRSFIASAIIWSIFCCIARAEFRRPAQEIAWHELECRVGRKTFQQKPRVVFRKPLDLFIIHRKENFIDRNLVTQKIISAKVKNKMTWGKIAKSIGQSKEWTTAAMLGQMTLTARQAAVAQELFDLTDEETLWLQIVPYKGSLPTPTDPLIYRWYEIVSVYGSTIKELIHEEFGDGIMSAIDFKMDIQRQADPNGDRVNVMLSGKFLPYKTY